MATTTPTTKTLYMKQGDGPLKTIVPVTVDIGTIITEVKQHFTENGAGFINNLLNQEAIKYGYTNILTACSYASTPNPYQTESQAFVAWQGALWQAFYTYVNSIDSTNYNTIDISTVVASLPQLITFLPTTVTPVV